MSRSLIAVNLKSFKTMSADSVKEMSAKLGTSRTNLSDVVNERDGRTSITAKGGTWVVV
jgi:hypothetical protein